MNGRGDECKRDCKNWPINTARFSPQSQRKLAHRHRHKFHLRTGAGDIELEAWYGQDPQDQHWGCPLRELWGVRPHQQMSPGWMETLAFTITATTSYESAAALLNKLGHQADDSSLHHLAQSLGQRAEQQMQERLKQPPRQPEPPPAPSAVAVLMLDGWQVRQRGPGWGTKKTTQNRVEWHELKTGVFYLQEHRARKNGRGVLSQKVVVSCQAEPMELGRRLHQEACERGLARAKARLTVADGAPWIWNVVQDRWPGATEVLDFYHASQHLWDLGEAIHGTRELARPWVENKLHQLRHGRQAAALREIADLPKGRGAVGPIVRREQNYFAEHACRMNYQTIARRGWPIGSGAVESACLQRQGRFKRSGQFWTASGLANLCALIEARQNGHWNKLWNS